MESPNRRHALRAPWSRRVGPYVAAVVVLMLAVGAWLWHAFPPPPRVVHMATGPAGGGYDLAGRRYREILARHGVELRLVPTAGSARNLSLLRDPGTGVSIALVQGGLAKPADAASIVSLGTTCNEPV